MRAAVIGIGSNSVRMLVAEAADGEIRRISRDRAGTRLFAGLDEAGNLSREAMASSCAAVKRMADSARSQGAEKVHLFATSATRDAANNADFAALLKAETDLTLEICSGDEEAALSFFGATDGGESGVIDIGGGSTEIIIGQGMNIRCSFSCQMGAVRLFQRIPIRDHGDLDAVEQHAADAEVEGGLLPEAVFDVIDEEADDHDPVPRVELVGAGELLVQRLVARIRARRAKFDKALAGAALGDGVHVGFHDRTAVERLAARVDLADARGGGVDEQHVVGDRAHDEVVAALALRAERFLGPGLCLLAAVAAGDFLAVVVAQLGVGEIEQQRDLGLTFHHHRLLGREQAENPHHDEAEQRGENDDQDASLETHE